MKNIDRLEEDNLGGLQVCFYTDWNNIDFSRFPKRDGLRLIGDIFLKPGCTWGLLVFTAFTAGFNHTAKTDRRGTLYTHEIKGFIPKARPALSEILHDMTGERRFAVLHRDHNGYMRLSGGPDYGLPFDSKFATGDNPADRNGYTTTFKAESLEPALFYSGAFTVTEGGTNPGSGSDGGSGGDGGATPAGYVDIVDGANRLLARVPVGQVFQIRSGFSYGFRIL